MINKNVTLVSFKELKNDLQGKKYVLPVDKSVDVATQKQHYILVQFYCEKKVSIQTMFLSLVPVIETIGQILSDKIVQELTAVGQTLKNCIGFASDGAASMVGGRN